MSGEFVCLACGQALPPVMGAANNSEGWPLRASVGGEMGFMKVVPPVPFDVLLDGEQQQRVVAYSLPEGFLLRMTDLLTADGYAVERVEGVVSLVARDGGEQ